MKALGLTRVKRLGWGVSFSGPLNQVKGMPVVLDSMGVFLELYSFEAGSVDDCIKASGILTGQASVL